MHVETKTEGYFIINSTAVYLGENEVVSYRSDAIIQEFETEEEMLAAHGEQFPEQYESEE
jgi:hypothetical protein